MRARAPVSLARTNSRPFHSHIGLATGRVDTAGRRYGRRRYRRTTTTQQTTSVREYPGRRLTNPTYRTRGLNRLRSGRHLHRLRERQGLQCQAVEQRMTVLAKETAPTAICTPPARSLTIGRPDQQDNSDTTTTTKPIAERGEYMAASRIAGCPPPQTHRRAASTQRTRPTTKPARLACLQGPSTEHGSTRGDSLPFAARKAPSSKL